MQNVRALVAGAAVVLLSLLAGLVWFIVLVVRHAFGEALLVCYLGLAALVVLVGGLCVLFALQQSLMLNLLKSSLTSLKGFLKIRLMALMAINFLAALLNWPAAILVEARRFTTSTDFRSQLRPLTGFSIHQYVYAAYNCVAAVLLALEARHSISGALQLTVLLVLISIMLRHLTLLATPGGAISFVKRGRVHPILSYLALALLDLVSLVLIDAVWGKWFAAKPLTLAVLKPTMTSFLAAPKHLVSALSDIATTGTLGIKLTGSTRHDELILLAGLLYYGSLVRVISGGFSSFDRNDDDLIIVATQYMAEGEYKDALGQLALLKSNSLQAEQIRAQALLALGDLKGAQASVRRRLVMDPAVTFDITPTDIFADLFDKAVVFNQSRAALWEEAVKAKVSQGMLATALMGELALAMAGTVDGVSVRDETLERAALVNACAEYFRHGPQPCLQTLAGFTPVDSAENLTFDVVKCVADLRLIEEDAARREAVAAWRKASGDALQARAGELIAGKSWERAAAATYCGFMLSYFQTFDLSAAQWIGALAEQAQRETEAAVPNSGAVARFLSKRIEDAAAAAEQNAAQSALPADAPEPGEHHPAA